LDFNQDITTHQAVGVSSAG